MRLIPEKYYRRYGCGSTKYRQCLISALLLAIVVVLLAIAFVFVYFFAIEGDDASSDVDSSPDT